MSIIFIRQQDYWIFPLSFFGVIFIAAALYIGVQTMSFPLALLGSGILYFVTNIIKKNYSKSLAARYIIICLIFAALGAAALYYLTN